MRKNVLLTILLIAFLFTLNVDESLACMYGPPYPIVCELYARADYVIVGKIKRVKPGASSQTVIIRVERTYKGQGLKQMVLNQPQHACGSDFSGEVGKTLLLYLVRNKKTRQYSAIDGAIDGRVERESESLYWLNGLPRSRNRTRLSGTVDFFRHDPFEFVNHLAGTKIKIFNNMKSFEVFTDENGVYEIWDIPTGKYQIEPVPPLNLEPSVLLEKGLIDFDSLKIINPNTRAVLIEIQRKGCGGIDFVFEEKTER